MPLGIDKDVSLGEREFIAKTEVVERPHALDVPVDDF